MQKLQKASIPRSVQFFSCRYVERDWTWEQYGTSIRNQTSYFFFIKIIFLSFAQQVISIVTVWLFSHGENHLVPELWEHSWVIRVSERRVTRNVRPRERRQSHDCSWRLWCPSIWTNLGAPKQRSLDKTNRSVLTLPYSCDYSWVSFRNYSGRSSEKLKVREDEIEEVKKQKEDFEKHRRGLEFSHMETDLDMDYCILIFIFCVTRMELRPNAWVFWLAITGRLEELRQDAWAFWLAVSWFGQLRSSAWGYDMTVTLHMTMRSSS